MGTAGDLFGISLSGPAVRQLVVVPQVGEVNMA